MPRTVKKPRSDRQNAAGAENLKHFRASCGGKPALRTGIYSFLKGGAIPTQVRGGVAIVAQVEGIISQVVREEGVAAKSQLSPARQAIVADLRRALTVLALVQIFVYRQHWGESSGRRVDPSKTENALRALFTKWRARVRRSFMTIGKADRVDSALVTLFSSVYEIANESGSKEPEVEPELAGMK